MLRYILFFLTLFLLVGCSQKVDYQSSKSYYIVIKNSSIKVADTGFIRRGNNEINLQIFAASTPILDLHVKQDVCIGYTCLSKISFNKRFFGFSHYESFVDELFNLQPIYHKTNLVKTPNGFEQKIETKDYSIIYRVDGENLYFKDKKNRILIKLKELK